MSDRGLEAFRTCLDSADDETRFNAAFAVNKLASVDKNIFTLGTSGFISR